MPPGAAGLGCGFDVLGWSLVAVAAFDFSRLAGVRRPVPGCCLKIRRIAYSRLTVCLHCALHNRAGPVSNSGSNWRIRRWGRPTLQRPGPVFTLEATGVVSMDRSRWAKPNVLEQVLRADLLTMIGRLRGLRDTLVHFADMISPPMGARTSLAVARVTNPRDRIRAAGFVGSHFTEK
jgi:hypothetical protein